jgi:hypothetical protein
MARRGRPEGSIIPLLSDPRRFEVATWFAAIRYGLVPYQAGYLTALLIASNKPITTESIDDVLLISSTKHSSKAVEYADRLQHRKVRQVIARANEREMTWLRMSSDYILVMLQCAAQSNWSGVAFTLELLRQAGWGDTLDRIGRRFEASLRGTNFPPAGGKLSRTAARLLRQVKSVPVN